jgi:very-short-patch-repair endonuclease
MDPDRRIDQFAAHQYGVVSLHQARQAGITDRMVDRRIESGAWIRMASGVYALASASPRWERQLSASVLSRPDALVAGRSAAYLHEFPGYGPGRPEIMVPTNGNARSPLARVIRSRYFHDIDAVRLGGFLVTGASETLVTISAKASVEHLEHLVDECLAAGRFEVDQLLDTIDRRPHLKGVPLLRRVAIERNEVAYQPPASELERLLYRLLDNPTIPPVSRQFPFQFEDMPMIVDAYIPQWRLIVEADGRRWHTRKADFERDRTRDNRATSQGVAVLRFTHRMLTTDLNDCLATLVKSGRARILVS